MRSWSTSIGLVGVTLALHAPLTLAQSGLPPTETQAEAPFLAENQVAMAKMMEAMAVEPSGDVDIDFAAIMIPHHQGAVEMAQAELRYGRNEQLRRIAQEIIVEQQQEIAAMRLALGQPPPPSAPSPTQPAPSPNGASQGGPARMHMERPTQ